tara:strand:- start:1123 stop:1389 length:267 start_codon:yes stop_codon:yes gene_type:complete
MNNIFKLSTIAILAFVANNSQATELVKVQTINTAELAKVTALNLAQSIKFNTLAINPIEKTARAQVAMNRAHLSKANKNISKAVVFAE